MAMEWPSWTHGSFDTTFALSSLYLWLIFGFLGTMLNCDLQRSMMQNIVVRHLTALLAFFFLFTLIESGAKVGLAATWVKTLLVYVVFVLASKSKWYFVVPVIGLMLVHQSVRRHVEYAEFSQTADAPRLRAMYVRLTTVINAIVLGLVVVGFIQYAYLQRIEYGKDFSWVKLFLGSTQPCKNQHPDYRSLAISRRTGLRG